MSKVEAENMPPPPDLPIPNGGADEMPIPQRMQAKSFAKEVEGLKKEAAPAPDPLNRMPNGIGDYDPAAPSPDPFDPENLRVRQDYTEHAVKPLLLKIPVRNPNPQDFVRVHPEHNVEVPLIVRKNDNEVYMVGPALRSSLNSETVTKCVHLAINQDGTVFLVPVGTRGPDGKLNEWHASMQQAIEIAKARWVRIKANKQINGYDVIPAKGIIADPEWPEQTFAQILRIAFQSYYIDAPDHPIIRKLEGL